MGFCAGGKPGWKGFPDLDALESIGLGTYRIGDRLKTDDWKLAQMERKENNALITFVKENTEYGD
jgi:hypothetical protein